MPSVARRDANRVAMKVAGLYALVAGVWILLSDRVMEGLSLSTSGIVATGKGILFVAVTSGVLFLAVRSWATRLGVEHGRALESERVLSQLARNVPVGLLMVDGKGCVSFMNSAAEALLDLDVSTCAGVHVTALSSGLPMEDSARVLSDIAAVSPASSAEIALPGGAPGRTVLVNAEYLDDEAPERGTLYAVSDVTDAVNVALRNQRLLRLQRFLTDVALTVSRAHDSRRLVTDVARLAVDKGGFSAAWVVWRSGSSREFETLTSIGLDAHGDALSALADVIPVSRTPWAEAFREGEIHITNTLEGLAGGGLAGLATDPDLGSFAAVPILETDETVAGLTLFAGEAGFFGAEELQTLRTLQAALTFGIERVGLDRRRIDAEEALERSETAYRRLFEQNPQPMWVYDLETLGFLAVNEAAVRKYGYSRAEFARMSIADIRPPEDVEALAHNVDSVEEGIDEAGVWRHVTKDGRMLAVDITSHTVEWAGRPAELVMVRDVTGLYEAEAELLARADRLDEVLAERATQLVQLRTCVSACLASQVPIMDIAVELRPKINGLVGFSAVVIRDMGESVTSEQRDALQRMSSEGRQMLSSLSDLDDVSRLEQGTLEVDRTTFDLTEALNRVMVAVRPKADAAGTFLSLDAESPLRVAGDPGRTVRVVRWLVEDALGRARGGSVDVTARVEGTDALVTVRARGGVDGQIAEQTDEVLLARRLGRVLAGGRPAIASDGEVAAFRFPAS